jgi:hypothetical protein
MKKTLPRFAGCEVIESEHQDPHTITLISYVRDEHGKLVPQVVQIVNVATSAPVVQLD